MKLSNGNKKTKGRVLGETAVCATLTALLLWWNPASDYDQQLTDQLFQKTTVASPHIQVIGIDDDTLNKFGTATTTWARERTAQLIEKLNADPDKAPAVIAIDIMFFTEGDAANDSALVQACSKYDNIILAAQAKYQKKVTQSGGKYILSSDYISEVTKPYEALDKAAPSAIVNTHLDSDGKVRNAIYSLESDGTTYYGLGVAAAMKYAQVNGLTLKEPVGVNSTGVFPIRYTAKSETYYGGNSFIKVLDGTIPAERFKGDIVFIGAFASGMMDSYLTPIDPAVPMNGVEVHANIADSVISERYYTEIPKNIQIILAVILVALMGYLLRKIKYIYGTLLLVFFAVIYLMTCFLAAKEGYVFSPLYPAALVILCYIEALGENYYFEQKHKKEIVGTFKQYVAPDVVDNILKEHSEGHALSGSRRDIAVMFTDIRGFTNISEHLTAEEVADILNSYFSLITRITFANGGTIDKFIGDGCMVLFNAPLSQEDYIFTAVKTALEIVKDFKALTAELLEAYGIEVSVGIGVNAGEAVVGNIGTEFRKDYTAIGDTVNTASRLEGLAKPGCVVITQDLMNTLNGRIKADSIGPVKIKGKANEIICYNVKEIVQGEL